MPSICVSRALLLASLTCLLLSAADAWIAPSSPSFAARASNKALNQADLSIGLATRSAVLHARQTAATADSPLAEPSLQDSISANLQLLKSAAATKAEDPDAVVQALLDLEKAMRAQAKADYPATAQSTLDKLNGDWQLVFTTGTKDTQAKIGRQITYFPLKAVQSFDTTLNAIQNGIYIGDWPAIKFAGNMEFDLKKRKLEFDFSSVRLLNLWTVNLSTGEAAELGAKSGLGAKNNVDNAKKDRKAFFNWISADESIATARGGGGGLALWKRIQDHKRE
jgi:PAP_fibrillin